jgi:Zn finger protein HypA/HybF involved in hydrogenase expression
VGEWVTRQHGSLSFRLTQVLSGHGCFGHYLHKVVEKEQSSRCHHCEADDDTAQHTLQFCPAWEEQRGVLVTEIGADLSLPTVFQAMARNAASWEAVASFCEHVMLQKEAAERGREEDPLAAPNRRRRQGRNRRLYGLMHPP